MNPYHARAIQTCSASLTHLLASLLFVSESSRNNEDRRIPGELFPGRKYLQPGQMRRRSTNRIIGEHREEALASSFFSPGLDGEFARRQAERNQGGRHRCCNYAHLRPLLRPASKNRRKTSPASRKLARTRGTARNTSVTATRLDCRSSPRHPSRLSFR